MKSGIIPNLWFDNEAEEAANFYVSVFPGGRILQVARYTEAATGPSGKPAGSVLTVDFEVNGQRMTAINGGPDFKPNEAVSLLVLCDDQAEIDQLWSRLTADGGEESMCGWLKDKYGFSWQIVPARMDEMMNENNEKKLDAMLAVMLEMRKLDIAALEKAYAAG